MSSMIEELMRGTGGAADGASSDGREKEVELACPECEKAGTPRSFGSPQGLANHRSRAHGVKSPRRKRRAKAAAPSAAAAPKAYDRDRALALVCPGSLPKDVELLSAMLDWTEAGELLAAVCRRKGR